MKKIHIPRPSERATITLAISFIGAVFNGLCSYILLDRYYNTQPEHCRTHIEEYAKEIDNWVDNWLTGSVVGILATAFLGYIVIYLLWYIGYRITRDK
ncbi:MAG: hypothetical protein J6Y71_11975 [Ruminococcus sp.]|nr:hypothetical protein [Ruminococcus sp.]